MPRQDLTYVVLAAGEARRMGFAKAVTPLGKLSPLARLTRTLGERRFIVVTIAALRVPCAKAAPGAAIVLNPQPQNGMTSSLRCASRTIDPSHGIGVLLADKPFLRTQTLERLEGAWRTSDCDVLFPLKANGVPGHPVYFSPRARALIGTLPDGDTLQRLRDDPALHRRTLPCDDDGAFVDLDTPADWSAAAHA